MNLEHVEAVATRRAVIVPSLVHSHEHDFGAPLPAWFQLSDLRFAIKAKFDDEVGGGTGAGGGSGRGPVTYDAPPPGFVPRHYHAHPRPLSAALTANGTGREGSVRQPAILAREARRDGRGYAGRSGPARGTVVTVDGARSRTVQKRVTA